MFEIMKIHIFYVNLRNFVWFFEKHRICHFRYLTKKQKRFPHFTVAFDFENVSMVKNWIHSRTKGNFSTQDTQRKYFQVILLCCTNDLVIWKRWYEKFTRKGMVHTSFRPQWFSITLKSLENVENCSWVLWHGTLATKSQTKRISWNKKMARLK